MPFRRFFERRGVKHPVAYSNAMLALGVIMCMVIAVTASVQASNRALRAEQARERSSFQAEQARERAANERGRVAFCVVVQSMYDVYKEIEPPTDNSIKVTRAWQSLAGIFNCVER
jgi:hypothetical protein